MLSLTSDSAESTQGDFVLEALDLCAFDSRLRMWLGVLFIFALAFIVLWPLLVGGRVLYWGTPLLQFYAWRSAAADMWRAGHLPLWLHALGNGAPLLANHQSAVLYPLNLWFLFMPAEHAMSYSAFLHLVLAGLGMFFFGRSLRLSHFASMVGAIAFMLSSFIVTRLNFPSMTCASAWLPWLLLAGERLIQRQRLLDVVLLGLVIGLQLLAGHAQLWYYSLWALALFVIYRLLTRPTSRRQIRPVGLLLLALVLGLALAAGQWLPTAELALHSQRQAGADYDFAMTYSFWPWRVITFFAPDFFGNPAHGDYWGYGNYWEDAGYVGLLPVLLLAPAIWGWFARRGNQSRPAGLAVMPFFLALAGLSLLLALGKNTPIYPFVFRYVPGFGFFQAPARFLIWTTLALATMAAIGADQLAVWPARTKWGRLGAVIGLALLLAGLVAWVALATVATTFGPALVRAGALLTLNSLCLLLPDCARPPALQKLTARWHWVLCLLLAGDLLWFGLPFTPTTTADAYHLPNRTAERLRQQNAGLFRIYTPEAAEYDIKFKKHLLFRTFDAGHPRDQLALRETLIPNTNVTEGIDSAGNFEPLLYGRYRRLMDVVNAAPASLQLRLLGMMNVAYILQPQEWAGLESIDDGTLFTRIYRNPVALPRAWWVSQARCVSNGEQALWLLQDPEFDPRQEVILENCMGQETLTGGGRQWALALPTLHYRPNGVTITTNVPAPGYLVLADTMYPGWRATIGGVPAHIYTANYAFRAVALPAGEQVIAFTYWPISIQIGLGVSIVAWAVWAVALILLKKGEVRVERA